MYRITERGRGGEEARGGAEEANPVIVSVYCPVYQLRAGRQTKVEPSERARISRCAQGFPRFFAEYGLADVCKEIT